MRRAATLTFTVILCAMFAASQQPSQIQITSGPIIEAVTDNTAVVAWGTNTGGSQVIKFGTSPNNLDRTAQDDYEKGRGTKRVTIKGLEPGGTYYFQVVSGNAQGSGTEAKSEVLQLRTLPSNGKLKPIYRLVNGPQHLFTTSYQETRVGNTTAGGWTREGVAGYISVEPREGAIPLFRLVQLNNNNHFYTTNAAEKDQAIKQSGYRDEGIAGYVAQAQEPGTAPLHRFYLPQQNVHFYTADEAEMNKLKSEGAWKYEGVAGYVWMEGQPANR